MIVEAALTIALAIPAPTPPVIAIASERPLVFPGMVRRCTSERLTIRGVPVTMRTCVYRVRRFPDRVHHLLGHD